MSRSLLHRWLPVLAGALLTAGVLRADRMAEMIEIHVEALGGRARIEALKSLRAAGSVIVAGKSVRFAMIAARPNRVRLETEADGRHLVQGFDGVDPAWELEPGLGGPRVRPMPERAAKTFITDAEFDDPLIGGPGRGYVCEFAGEVEKDGRKHLRVLVTRHLKDTYSLLVDATTFFIVQRIEQRTSVTGRKVEVVTEFADFRPVDGVLLAHQLTVSIDGRPSQQTRIERIEANVELAAEAFVRPKA